MQTLMLNLKILAVFTDFKLFAMNKSNKSIVSQQIFPKFNF